MIHESHQEKNDLYVCKIRKKHEFVVLGCDGHWLWGCHGHTILFAFSIGLIKMWSVETSSLCGFHLYVWREGTTGPYVAKVETIT